VSVSYKKLRKLLIDKEMTRTDLRLAVGASTSTFAKLSKGEFISGDLMARICKALNCNVGDMMDIVLDDEENIGEMAEIRHQGLPQNKTMAR